MVKRVSVAIKKPQVPEFVLPMGTTSRVDSAEQNRGFFGVLNVRTQVVRMIGSCSNLENNSIFQNPILTGTVLHTYTWLYIKEIKYNKQTTRPSSHVALTMVHSCSEMFMIHLVC